MVQPEGACLLADVSPVVATLCFSQPALSVRLREDLRKRAAPIGIGVAVRAGARLPGSSTDAETTLAELDLYEEITDRDCVTPHDEGVIDLGRLLRALPQPLRPHSGV